MSVNSLESTLIYTCISLFNHNIFFRFYYLIFCIQLLRSKRHKQSWILLGIDVHCAIFKRKTPKQGFQQRDTRTLYNIYSWPILSFSLKCSYTRLIDDWCKCWTTSIKIPIIHTDIEVDWLQFENYFLSAITRRLTLLLFITIQWWNCSSYLVTS